ncbi:hypothetical protein BJ322DRAFT_548976 [Thelephora terrestris]|uniref:Uncharacterized protein n=1 Tax=Thelephora terrestris TaxID=56493 RepID=A0A9P6LAM2_9AGAM|nr:hypothetical protein BJ322DRAFT_548976 [Thelephora terrestris]
MTHIELRELHRPLFLMLLFAGLRSTRECTQTNPAVYLQLLGFLTSSSGWLVGDFVTGSASAWRLLRSRDPESVECA